MNFYLFFRKKLTLTTPTIFFDKRDMTIAAIFWQFNTFFYCDEQKLDIFLYLYVCTKSKKIWYNIFPAVYSYPLSYEEILLKQRTANNNSNNHNLEEYRNFLYVYVRKYICTLTMFMQIYIEKYIYTFIYR